MSGAGSPPAVTHTATVTPPYRKRHYVPNSRSSDSLPSPSELLPKNLDKRLRTGSKATALPHDALAGFQSTSTLVRFNVLKLQQDLVESVERKKETKGIATEKKSRIKKNNGAENAAEKPGKPKQNSVQKASERPKNSRKRKSEDAVVSSAPRQATGTESSRSACAVLGLEHNIDGKHNIPTDTSDGHKRQKFEDGESASHEQSTKGKSTKKPRRTAKNSSHFEAQRSPSAPPHLEVESDHPCMEAALPRKKNWTPPKTIQIAIPDISPEPTTAGDAAISPTEEAHTISKLNVAKLQEDFAYDGSLSAVAGPANQKSCGSCPTVRHINHIPSLVPQACPAVVDSLVKPPKVSSTKRIEIAPVAALGPSPVKQTKKISPKKGPGGITARSIARYAQPQEANPIEISTEGSPHFAPVFDKPNVTVIEEVKGSAKKTTSVRKPRKVRTKEDGVAKAAKKTKKASTKPKAVAFVVPKLASPKQHDGKLKRQDLLFGTSSQLRQNESPTYLRQMQQALRESEIDVAQSEKDAGSSSITLRLSEAIRRTSSKLWSQSAHDDGDGDWQLILDSDGSKCITPDLDAGVVVNEPQEMIPGAFHKAASPAISYDLISSPGYQEIPPVASNGFWISGQTSNVSHHSLAANPFRISPILRSPVSPTRVALRALSTNTRFSTKQSTVGSADYPGAIEGINVCDIVRSAAVSHKSPQRSPLKAKPGGPPSSPAKPRGRPRKSPGLAADIPETPQKRGRPLKAREEQVETTSCGAAAGGNDLDGFQHIDEIEDSEVDHTPTPPRRHRPVSSSPPLPLSASKPPINKRASTAIVNDQHPRWPDVKAKLFPEITNVVNATPASGNMKNPTWHEKILLYDPIVLEDFTEWLNAKGLRIEGKDNTLVEISCWMVQCWCEMNSICCLWKEGLRGGVRTKY